MAWFKRKNKPMSEVGTGFLPPPEISQIEEPEKEEDVYRCQSLKEDLKDRQHTRKLREGYARFSAALAFFSFSFWAVFVLCKYTKNDYNVTDLMTITTGSTVNIIASFLVVTKGLFPNKKD